MSSPAADGDESAIVHDAETLMLIEQELEHWPPAERARRFAEWKNLPPAMVRTLIANMQQVRRMGHQLSSGRARAADEPLPGRPDPQWEDFVSARSMGSSVSVGGGAGHSFERAPEPPGAMRATGGVVHAGLGVQPWGDETRQPGPAEAADWDWAAGRGGNSYVRQVSGNDAEREVGESQSRRVTKDAPTQPPGGEGSGVRSQESGVTGQTLNSQLGDHSPPTTHHSPSQSSIADPDARPNRELDSRFSIPGGAVSGRSPASWDDQLADLIETAEAAVAGIQPHGGEERLRLYIERHVYLRMLYLMAGRQEQALTAIPGIPAAEKEFWQQVFWALANYFHAEAMPRRDDRATQTVSQLRTAVGRLQETARLALRNVAFCQRINSFGSYEPYAEGEFRPGQPVLVYAEVENFKSAATDDGRYRTALKSQIDIYEAGPDGQRLESIDFPTTEDVCRNPRRDYFHSYEILIPKSAAPGPHVLKLTVEDELTGRTATYAVNFTVR